MKYKIDIEGMHCLGCQNLIKMSLEDASFEDVSVSMSDGLATFSSQQGKSATKESLDSIFSAFDKYKYSNFVTISV